MNLDWNLLSILGGGFAWLAAVLLAQKGFFDQVELLLFFGMAVVTPLALRLGAFGTAHPLHHTLILLQPICAGLAGLSFVTDLAWLVLPWVGMVLGMAGWGAVRLLPRPMTTLEELCIDVGFLYVAVSGVWLLAYAFEVNLLGFSRAIVALTVAHFTFISLGALMITGMLGRNLPKEGRLWGLYRIGAMGAILSPALVATGITFSLTVEVIATALLAASFLMLSVVTLLGGLPNPRQARVLVAISASSLFITLALAFAFPLGRYTGWWDLDLSEMLRWHGWLNALGFVFLGLLGWNLVMPPSRVPHHQIPFSQLKEGWRVGADYFVRLDAIDPAKSAQGIVDDLRGDFGLESVPAQICHFYEHTADYDLQIVPTWYGIFRWLAPLYKRLSASMEQINFPGQDGGDENELTSQIVPLKDAMDGRQNVRGWVRAYRGSNKSIYVAAYSQHSHAGITYMNIAFPMLGGNMTSILQLQAQPDGGLRLYTQSSLHEHQGVYFATRWLPIRLPFNEVITVKHDMTAQHDMWIAGVKFLRLQYVLQRVSGGGTSLQS